LLPSPPATFAVAARVPAALAAAAALAALAARRPRAPGHLATRAAAAVLAAAALAAVVLAAAAAAAATTTSTSASAFITTVSASISAAVLAATATADSAALAAAALRRLLRVATAAAAATTAAATTTAATTVAATITAAATAATASIAWLHRGPAWQPAKAHPAPARANVRPDARTRAAAAGHAVACSVHCVHGARRAVSAACVVAGRPPPRDVAVACMLPHLAGCVTDAPVASGGSEAAPGGLSWVWGWCGVVLGSGGAQEARLGAACGRDRAARCRANVRKKSRFVEIVDSVSCKDMC